MAASTNPLASSLSLTALGSADWAIVAHEASIDLQDWCVIDPTPPPPTPLATQGYMERLVYNRFLEEAVFGPKALREAKPTGDAQNYLANTLYEEVSIPYTPTQNLTGLLFGRYDETGKALPFDKGSVTCLVLSGTGAPLEAYVMGIIEGYRNEGCQVLAVNYVGFGNNAHLGSPSATNVFACAEAALTFLFNRGVHDDSLLVHGYSMGGVAAARLAQKYNTHLVVDRTSISTEEIAYAMLTQQRQTTAMQRFVCCMAAKVAMYGVPFSIAESIGKVRRKIFVVQEQEPVTQKIGALPLVEKLLTEKALLAQEVVTKWIAPNHISSPVCTWTVDGAKFAAKLGVSFYPYWEMDKNEEARKSWQQFIKGIRALKV